MMENLRAAFLRFMRLPPEPAPPAGSPDSIKIFRAAKNYFRFKLFLWGAFQCVHVAPLAFGGLILFGILKDLPPVELWVITVWVVAGIIFLIQLPFSYLVVRFDYELRWYIVTDRSLRLRYGIQWVREMTMTFANIQQITVHQGPVQRLLGIADLKVQTAGGGGGVISPHSGVGREQMHVAHFRGVDNAVEIRDLILDRLRKFRDTGLGDPDEGMAGHENPAATPVGEKEVIEAARLLLMEARMLRERWVKI